MKKLFAVCAVVISTGLAACQKTDGSLPNDPTAGIPDAATSDRPHDVRPPPASSGMSSDPNNPSGAPGPSSGLGTSPNRL